jgi:hypothetical protein
VPVAVELAATDTAAPAAPAAPAAFPDAPELLRFSAMVVLSKQEAFDACAGLVDITRLLLADGHPTEALWAELLFELLEAALCDQSAALTSASVTRSSRARTQVTES